MAITQTARLLEHLNTSGSNPGYVVDPAPVSSFTIGAGKLALLTHRGIHFQPTNAAPPSSITGTGITFDKIIDTLDTVTGVCLSVWRALPGSGFTGTCSIALPQTLYESSVSISEFDGIDTSGTNGSGAIVQSVSAQELTGSGTSCPATLAAFGDVANGAYYATSYTQAGNTSRTCTPDTGWTEIHDGGTDYVGAAAWGGIETQWRASNDTSATGTWAAAGYLHSIAIELKAAGAGGGTTTKVMSDTLALSDAALDPTYRVRQMSDTTVVTDGVVQWRRLKRVMDEAATVIDSVVKTLILGGTIVYTKVMTDTLGITDALIKWLRMVRGPIDTVTLSDGDTYRFSIVTASESVDMADGFVSWRRLVRVAQDTISVTDGFSKTLSGAGIVYAKVMSDTVTLIDDAGQRWRLRFTQLTDAVGLSDQVIRALRAVRSLGDVVEFSDGTVKVRRMVRSLDESIEISDDKVSTLYLDQMSNTSFTFGSSGPPFRFGGM